MLKYVVLKCCDRLTTASLALDMLCWPNCFKKRGHGFMFCALFYNNIVLCFRSNCKQV